MRHDHDPTLLPSVLPASAAPGRTRSALAGLSAIAAVTLGLVALAVTASGAPPVAPLAPAAAGETATVESIGPSQPRLVLQTTLGPPITAVCPQSDLPTCSVPFHTRTTAAPTEVTAAPWSTRPPPRHLIPEPGPAPQPQPQPRQEPTPDHPAPGAPPPLPAGITVDVRLSSTSLVAGQATDATVRIRNATSHAFPVFTGCGVTWVSLADEAGTDVTDRANAEPCGTPGHYFSPTTVQAGGSLERVLPLTPLRTTSGPHQVRAAWARDTGPGLIHYIDAPPVAVLVTAAARAATSPGRPAAPRG